MPDCVWPLCVAHTDDSLKKASCHSPSAATQTNSHDLSRLTCSLKAAVAQIYHSLPLHGKQAWIRLHIEPTKQPHTPQVNRPHLIKVNTFLNHEALLPASPYPFAFNRPSPYKIFLPRPSETFR